MAFLLYRKLRVFVKKKTYVQMSEYSGNNILLIKYTNKNKKRWKNIKNILTKREKCDILYLTNNRAVFQDRREL